MRHFLDLNQIPPEELRGILDQSLATKQARAGQPKLTPDAEQPFANRIVALIFEKPSTRTRISFDVGVRQMGGQTMVLSGSELQLGHGETVGDTARVLSRYVDADHDPHLPRGNLAGTGRCRDRAGDQRADQ